MERFDMEELYEKAGGIFRLTVLVQKRLKQLNNGRSSLMKTDNRSLKDVVYREILDGKIKLVADEVENTEETETTDTVRDMFNKAKSSFQLPSLK